MQHVPQRLPPLSLLVFEEPDLVLHYESRLVEVQALFKTGVVVLQLLRIIEELLGGSVEVQRMELNRE